MMNIFDELLHRLGSKTRIRSLFKDIAMDEMERIIHRLNEVLEEKNQEKEAEELKRKEKLQSVEEIKKVMESKGLSMSDLNLLQEMGKEGKRKRNVSKHNFEYQTASGDTVRWYGSTTGRLPKDFQDYLDRTGKKRIDCIVDDE
ncbi:H-NS family nucleoid-associated regulatory protein [Endozoicomonas arenosclerae]|uniref:H-NS family histone-like protein n=1 Tax=Endozoicomonas arenosclerae TaxID=1633495 RepID=UPI0007823D80|nr:H-NS family nucleoid-associated regulatory protein [Endozoicomonas arenosclerae]